MKNDLINRELHQFCIFAVPISSARAGLYFFTFTYFFFGHSCDVVVIYSALLLCWPHLDILTE